MEILLRWSCVGRWCQSSGSIIVSLCLLLWSKSLEWIRLMGWLIRSTSMTQIIRISWNLVTIVWCVGWGGLSNLRSWGSWIIWVNLGVICRIIGRLWTDWYLSKWIIIWCYFWRKIWTRRGQNILFFLRTHSETKSIKIISRNRW